MYNYSWLSLEDLTCYVRTGYQYSVSREGIKTLSAASVKDAVNQHGEETQTSIMLIYCAAGPEQVKNIQTL